MKETVLMAVSKPVTQAEFDATGCPHCGIPRYYELMNLGGDCLVVCQECEQHFVILGTAADDVEGT